MKHLLIALILGISTLCLANGGNEEDITRSFRVFTKNVEVDQMSGRSITMSSESSNYTVKLIPVEEGHVTFSLTEISFRTTWNVPDIHFRALIKGYVNGVEVSPVFSLDGNNKELYQRDNFVIFKHIFGSIPVWFEESVDSVLIDYSNSHNMVLDQYLTLDDLRMLPFTEIVHNPDPSTRSEGHDIMIALDGSSSVDKKDRRNIYHNVRYLLKQLKFTEVDSQLVIMDFGTEVNGMFEFESGKQYRRNLKTFKKRDYDDKKLRYTNWGSALQVAIEEKPKTFILFTDGWSNYYGEEKSQFFDHFVELVDLCNQLKSNGTRLLFITSGMHYTEGSYDVFAHFLDGKKSVVWHDGMPPSMFDFKNTDLIALHEFTSMDMIKSSDSFAAD